MSRNNSVYIDPVPAHGLSADGHRLVTMTCSVCGTKTTGRRQD